MATFEFCAMSEQDQAALRDNPRRCVALLRPCKPLADKLAGTGGIYAPLSVDDERLLQAFHLVQQSHEGYQYEGAFDQFGVPTFLPPKIPAKAPARSRTEGSEAGSPVAWQQRKRYS